MHEMALCECLVEIMEQEAASGGFHRVHSVSLEVGPLAGVERDALRFGFQAVTPGTLADGAVLRIVGALAQARCPSCGWQSTLSRPISLCPVCDELLNVSGGCELRITEMEVE